MNQDNLETWNIANLSLDPMFSDTMYYWVSVENKENPYENLPEDAIIMPFFEFCKAFPCHAGPNIYIRDSSKMENTIISKEGIPLFSVGLFIYIL